jgi:hypothetical protein
LNLSPQHSQVLKRDSSFIQLPDFQIFRKIDSSKKSKLKEVDDLFMIFSRKCRKRPLTRRKKDIHKKIQGQKIPANLGQMKTAVTNNTIMNEKHYKK